MAQHTAWKGTISVGGVINAKVRLVKATSEHSSSVAMHEYHKSDMGQGGRKTICKKCGVDLSKDDIVKGIEVSKGKIVTLTQAELDTLPLKSARVVDLTFVPAQDITSIAFDESYYIRPDEDADVQPFVMVMEGMKKAGKVAVGKIAMQREHLCVIRDVGNDYVLNLLHWGDELAQSPTLPQNTTPPATADLMQKIIGMFSKPFNFTDYVDNYTDALKKLATSKAAGIALDVPLEAPTPTMSLNEAMQKLINGG